MIRKGLFTIFVQLVGKTVKVRLQNMLPRLKIVPIKFDFWTARRQGFVLLPNPYFSGPGHVTNY